MSLTDALLTDKFHLDLLSRSQLCNQNVMNKRLGSLNALSLEPSFLIADRNPLEIPRVHVGIVEVLVLVFSVVQNDRLAGVLLRALDMELESQRVLSGEWFAFPTELKYPGVHGDRDQTHSVSEVLIGNYACVLPHLDLFNRHRGDLGNHDSSERVRKGRFDAFHLEDNFLTVEGFDLDIAVLDEVLEGRGVELVA